MSLIIFSISCISETSITLWYYFRFIEQCTEVEEEVCKTVYDEVWEKKCETVNITLPQKDCREFTETQMETKYVTFYLFFNILKMA